VRVKSEHAVGYIKGRFASLKGLRQQIDDELDHRRALEWVRACLVLHILISRLEAADSTLEPDKDFVEELVSEGLDGSDSEDSDV
ncbi:hypothetical protein M422DRAFT_141351, partial [Sphaerobolus stellatus SS14]